jgi:catechol 2,3-dioxygenase-like lactoylglutathione lyase family enzyme
MRLVVHLQRTQIRLGVDDSTRSIAFYEALFGGPPASRTAEVIVFEFDEPDLLLVLETRPVARRSGGRTKNRARPAPRRPATTAQARYALVVPDPELVGKAAVALWRVGAPLRLQDQGIETFDPDGNTWKVRFVPFAGKPAVIAVSQEGPHARN